MCDVLLYYAELITDSRRSERTTITHPCLLLVPGTVHGVVRRVGLRGAGTLCHVTEHVTCRQSRRRGRGAQALQPLPALTSLLT